MAPVKRAVINLAPQHKFKGLSKWPEAQLLLLMPRVLWNRTRVYVPYFEAVHLSGRFGADPGDFEWEVIDDPQGLKWWRRTAGGDAAYCAFIVAPDLTMDPLEVFGIIDIASDTPWWFDGVDDATRTETRGETYARQNRLSEHDGKVFVSMRDDYKPRNLITAERDESGIAWRVGSDEEVEKLKGAFVGLVNRARVATLPEEALRGKTGDLKPSTGSLKPAASPPKPQSSPLKPTANPPKPTTGSLKDTLSNLIKPITGPFKKE
jgi:hypothetical protein